MSMLVEAPAAVEDALASLLDDADPLVQRRALATYVRRLYYPFLLHDPQLAAVAEGPAKALAAGGLGGGWRAVGGGRWTVGGGRWAVGGEGVALLRGAALCWNFESRFLEAML